MLKLTIADKLWIAWWIHDNIDAYANITFFSQYAAFNISWSEKPLSSKWIYSYIENPHTGKRGYLTKQGMDNFAGSHKQFYQEFIEQQTKLRYLK